MTKKNAAHPGMDGGASKACLAGDGSGFPAGNRVTVRQAEPLGEDANWDGRKGGSQASTQAEIQINDGKCKATTSITVNAAAPITS